MLCSKCGMLIENSARFCSRCGTPIVQFASYPPYHQQKTKKGAGCIIAFFVILIIAVLMVWIVHLTGIYTPQNERIANWEEEHPEWIRIADGLYINEKTDSHVEGGYGLYTSTIRGVVGALKDFNYIGISFSLYDENGSKIGSAYANIAGLREGETWSFEAIGLAKADSCKFDSVDCW